MEWWPLWGLVLARAAGVFALAPPTGWQPLPVSLRLGVAALVALPVTFAVMPPQPLALGLPDYLAALLGEAAVGLGMGLALGLLLWAAGAAGHLQDVAGGFGATDDEEGPLARLFLILAVLFFLQLNGLEWLVAFFRHSYALVPVGHGVPLAPAGDWVAWPGLMLAAALQLAAPMVLAVLLAALMVTSLQRVLPDLRAQELLPAARALVTLLALVVLAPLLGSAFLQQIGVAAETAARWLVAVR